MLRQILASSLTLLFSVTVVARAQTQAPPSTPEDRARMVEVARSLEADPLGAQAPEQRRWALRWLTDVPDISVKVCPGLLGPVLGSKKNYAAEIVTQMLSSAAAFMIANPDKAKDDVAVYVAAVEGSLRVYESILRVKPKAKWPFLDDLLEKRSKGELGEYVRQAVAAQCKSPK